ncbi:TasA family protein [Clavibacter michiganensis]|uniref:TasA family protein n=1 Tax=Clavibacter michiganensis TaxID=28447 RepID=UPI000A3A4C77|nr:TasA family protein [Clavibacter michiganensis]MDO4060792.1 TasA family protein [Clavibacter michiganensis]MDO4073311.1 TasA family protein [Clavibacter michiganensis]MDO4078589.1 TasA family protein [Clavibacter michiganensis]MDO4100177.1 TasA family protein [Clavibacter michiganensis]MDO4128446.1 TasA family protein [Clavibacter michiganensis]
MPRHRAAPDAPARPVPHGRRAARRPVRRARTLLVTAIAVTLALAGAGTAYAVFADRATSRVTVRAGAVELDWGGGGADQLAVPITGLRPGDAQVRLVDLANTGTVRASELMVTLGGTAVASTSDGLQVAFDRCTVAWTGAPGTATCSGTITSVVADRPVVGRVALPGSPARAVGGRDHLRLTVRLAASAPTGAQNVTGSVTLRVDGNQRPGLQR